MITNSVNIYRIEEIPQDQLNLNDNEIMVSVSHIKDSLQTNIPPFYIKLCKGEKFIEVKNRIRNKIKAFQGEFEQVRNKKL